ncbi:MAG: hypothetical protein LBJ78_00375 [Puniceicoccales bacterium]|jgi:hypothetical protein|nr:hypothetical protein [Puniceicoccales bacterium]
MPIDFPTLLSPLTTPPSGDPSLNPGDGPTHSTNPFSDDTTGTFTPTIVDVLNGLRAAQNKTPLTNPQQGLEEILTRCPQTSQKIIDDIQRIKDSGVFADGHLDITKLDDDGLALLCMLFTQKSKSELIKSLQQAVANKTAERSQAQDDYLQEKQKVVDDAIKLAKEIEEQNKKSLWKAIFGIVAAVVAVVVAVAVTIGTFGAAGPVAGLAIAACVCSCIGATAGLAAASCTLAACCVDDPEVKAALGKAAMGLGIAAAVFGIAGAVCGGFAGTGQSLDAVVQMVKRGGQIAGVLTTIAQGSLAIAEGVGNMELAESMKELAEKKIKMEQLDADVEFLEALIKMLGKSAEEFLELFLNTEEVVAGELNRGADADSEIAGKIA